MKFKVIAFIVLSFISFRVFSAPFGPGDFEKFKAKKVAYITEAINLTPAEAQKFWPVYNVYEQKKFEIMKERHELEEKLRGNDELSDDSYVELSRKMASFDKRHGDLQIEYNEKFLKILPPQKVVKLYVAEIEFKGYLLKEFKSKDHDPDKK